MLKVKDLRVFIFIWAVIFSLAGFLLDIKEWFYISSLFILLGVLKPRLFTTFYVVWVRVGEIIGGVLSKVILLILFFGVFTPVSIILKLLGKDLLNKKMDKSKQSYWVDREVQPQSMKNQF